jgi:glycosyltransferase involved in cell wall biosynthesis
MGRFAFRSRPRGKNLACVGYVNMHKNPMLLLQCFKKLRDADPEFRLFFAGNFQDDGVLEAYLRNMVGELCLESAVSFEGWQSDTPAWLEDKHYLVTASLVEGHPVGVLEGMARGLKPVVHAFPGCRDFFPDAYLWRTVDEFCTRILSDPYQPEEYRDFVAARYSLKTQLDTINSLLLEFEKSPVSKPDTPAAPAIAGRPAGERAADA